MTFEVLLGIASVAASVMAVIGGVIALLVGGAAARKQALVLKRIRVESVIAESNLNSLGQLFVRDLGGTSMPSYVRDPQQRMEFRHAFNAVRDFIGEQHPPSGVAAPEAMAPEPAETIDWMRDSEPQTLTAQRALREVADGESWNALARMRRTLEMAVAQRFEEAHGKQRRLAAGQLIAVAAKRGVIPRDAPDTLRYAISVANRAVHGEDVPPDVAVEAIVLIDRFLRELDQFSQD